MWFKWKEKIIDSAYMKVQCCNDCGWFKRPYFLAPPYRECCPNCGNIDSLSFEVGKLKMLKRKHFLCGEETYYLEFNKKVK